MQNKKEIKVIITEDLYEAASAVTNGAFIKLALDIFNLDLNKVSIHIDPSSYDCVYSKYIGDEVNVTLVVENGLHVITVSTIDSQYPSNINKGVKDASR